MNIKIIIKYIEHFLIVLLTIWFLYTFIFVILAYNGSVQKLKIQFGTKGDAVVPVWAPYGFINQNMKMNGFLYSIYLPFYDLNRFIHSEVQEEGKP